MDEELSFLLPGCEDTQVHIKIICKPASHCLMLITSTVPLSPEPNADVPMGSLVYALPDRFNPQEPMHTTIVPNEASIDFTVRLAKVLVKKTGLHVWLTNSISLAAAPLGGTPDEEMEVFSQVVRVVMSNLEMCPDLDMSTIDAQSTNRSFSNGVSSTGVDSDAGIDSTDNTATKNTP